MRYMGFVRTAALLLEQQRQKKEAEEQAKDQQVPEKPFATDEKTVCYVFYRYIFLHQLTSIVLKLHCVGHELIAAASILS